jgi:hypothetical protein
MDPRSLEFWEWFYSVANEGPSMGHEERQREVERRWHPDLTLIQSPDMLDTAGEFHGYEGLAAANREIFESWETIEWKPRELHELGDDRYLILLQTSGRARRSGLELGGPSGDLGHIVTLRDGKAERMEVFLGWDAARKAAGLA